MRCFDVRGTELAGRSLTAVCYKVALGLGDPRWEGDSVFLYVFGGCVINVKSLVLYWFLISGNPD